MASNVGTSAVNGFTAFSMEVSSAERNLLSDLRSQLNSMMVRFEELQRENHRLLSRISRCQCSETMAPGGKGGRKPENEKGKGKATIKYPEHFTSYSAKSEGISQSIKQDSELSMSESSTNTSFSNNKFEVSSKDCKHSLHVEKSSNCTSLEQKKQPDQRVVTHEYDKRYVALKIVYFGHRFYGFASEAQMEPTVESEIFKALERTKLLVGTRKESHYSRCGRTDKGVSATGQVISLYLRSNGKHIEEKEIDYVKVLNKALPKDIRVIGSASVLPEFSARFSCLNREYRYLFWRGTMDISVMQNAARKFIGEHDFRNFCKMDAVNVNNYKRLITEFSVHPCSKWSNDDKLWAITIKGSAFLWHQVRCMVSVLFMIGGGLESPNIIDALLDINKTLRKPQYTMASELPLMLHCCEFQDVKFICSSDSMKNLVGHLTNELRSNLLQAAIVEEALNCLQTLVVEESPVQHHKKKKGHVSLVLRPMEPSYEERRLKLAMRDSYSRPAS